MTPTLHSKQRPTYFSINHQSHIALVATVQIRIPEVEYIALFSLTGLPVRELGNGNSHEQAFAWARADLEHDSYAVNDDGTVYDGSKFVGLLYTSTRNNPTYAPVNDPVTPRPRYDENADDCNGEDDCRCIACEGYAKSLANT